MTDLTLSLQASSPFDAIRHTRPDGSEYWSAREMQPLQGYSNWQNFVKAIERAKLAAANTGVDVDSAFVQVAKLTVVDKLGDQRRYDYELSRFACYLVALNGDPAKPEVAAAQAYFVVKTREAETAAAPATLDSVLAALAELAYREHVVPFAGRTLAFQRWRKPRKGMKAFVQLTIDLNLTGADGGTVSITADRKALKGGGDR